MYCQRHLHLYIPWISIQKSPWNDRLWAETMNCLKFTKSMEHNSVKNYSTITNKKLVLGILTTCLSWKWASVTETISEHWIHHNVRKERVTLYMYVPVISSWGHKNLTIVSTVVFITVVVTVVVMVTHPGWWYTTLVITCELCLGAGRVLCKMIHHS